MNSTKMKYVHLLENPCTVVEQSMRKTKDRRSGMRGPPLSFVLTTSGPATINALSYTNNREVGREGGPGGGCGHQRKFTNPRHQIQPESV